MAQTNFGALTDAQKKVWSRDVWKMARNRSFTAQFSGSGSNAMVTRVTELTKTSRGDKAVIQLVPDLEGDGVAGDNTLEGNEEALTNYAQTITIDQLRHANRTKGKMSDQRTVINFREQSRDVLAYWLADRIDQMAFLTLSGVAYTQKNDGTSRTASALPDLAFAADVAAPTSGRHYQWDGAAKAFTTLNTGTLVQADDRVGYQALVRLKATAKDQYVRGVRGSAGDEMYHVFMTPTSLANLKLDSDFLANVRNAGVRGGKNPLFAGGESFMVDGMWIHEFRHVYHNATWGDAGGERILLCGAQALGLADIGTPEWNEEQFDYKNQQGIEVGKIFGMLKPQFHSIYTGQTEDFGVLTLDVSQ